LEVQLQQAGATIPAGEFCAIVSNCFHVVESRYYDRVHGEIFASATEPAWHEALEAVLSRLGRPLAILDVGCGTGFEAEVVLRHVGPARIRKIVCSDPSPEMLGGCRRRLSAFECDQAFLCSDISRVPPEPQGFDLIVSNSVVHHVYDLPGFFARLDTLAAPGAVYVAGHEPAAAFYENEAMKRWNRLFNRSRRIRLNLSVRRLARRLATAAGFRQREPAITDLVNGQLLRDGYAVKPLAANAIRKMVDIHVPLSSGQYPWGEPGFSPDEIVKTYLPGWAAVFAKTYHHIKAPATSLSAPWRAVARRLESRYPDCGSDIIMAFAKQA
jgi:SAM-dependent methyltransferase